MALGESDGRDDQDKHKAILAAMLLRAMARFQATKQLLNRQLPR
jgi:hypothetical protein